MDDRVEPSTVDQLTVTKRTRERECDRFVITATFFSFATGADDGSPLNEAIYQRRGGREGRQRGRMAMTTCPLSQDSRKQRRGRH